MSEINVKVGEKPEIFSLRRERGGSIEINRPRFGEKISRRQSQRQGC
jgi:hypothetical protein